MQQALGALGSEDSLGRAFRQRHGCAVLHADVGRGNGEAFIHVAALVVHWARVERVDGIAVGTSVEGRLLTIEARQPVLALALCIRALLRALVQVAVPALDMVITVSLWML